MTSVASEREIAGLPLADDPRWNCPRSRRRCVSWVVGRERPVTGTGPPPLRPFGLKLHHDGSWTHEGLPLRNRKLREVFDRSVCYLPGEQKYVVQIKHFRGEIEVEEAPFFVLEVDCERGHVRLSDRSWERFHPESLSLSPMDGAFLCRVKRDLLAGGIAARFRHAAQAELLIAVEEIGEGLRRPAWGRGAATPRWHRRLTPAFARVTPTGGGGVAKW